MEKEGKIAESLELVRKLTSKYGFDFYLWITAAQALWSGGEKEEANKFCQEILSREPEHYMAKYWSGRYCLEKEEYFKARDLFLELLQVNPRSDELTAYLETANEKLIVEIREALEKGEPIMNSPDRNYGCGLAGVFSRTKSWRKPRRSPKMLTLREKRNTSTATCSAVLNMPWKSMKKAFLC